MRRKADKKRRVKLTKRSSCLNSSFICLFLLQVYSDPLCNFVWTARLYVCFYYRSVQTACTILSEQLFFMFALITGLFRSLVQFCRNSSFRCVYCHNSSVQVPVYWCLRRSFVCLLSSKVCSGLYALLSEQISCLMFDVVGGAFRSTCIIVRAGLYMFAEYNQQDVTFHNFFISVRRSTCFRRFFRPSSGAQNCTYSVRYWSDSYLLLYVQFWAPDDGPMLLPAASLSRLAAGSSNGLTATWRCMCSFEFLMMDGKTVWNM